MPKLFLGCCKNIINLYIYITSVTRGMLASSMPYAFAYIFYFKLNKDAYESGNFNI